MLEWMVKVILAYLLGSISGSLLLGRWRGVDIRTQGSGNAGGTNALRTQGAGFALAVIIIDIGKGALAAGWLATWSWSGSPPAAQWLPAACGLAAVAGHIWPLYFSFRGGKGAGTVVGALAVLAPLIMAGMIAVWLVVLILSGYVGLSTMLAATSIPLLAWLLSSAPVTVMLTFGIAVAILMLWTHRSNIQRLRQGCENRFERVRVINWRRRS